VHEVAGEGPPVLLIHEGMCDSIWESQWRTFLKVLLLRGEPQEVGPREWLQY
jgi:hypothetical protein